MSSLTALETGLSILIPSGFKWSKQVLQHRPGFQLVHHISAKNLPALKAIITQFLDCGENLDIFAPIATVASPLDQINNVDMAIANGLSWASAHVDHGKDSVRKLTDRHSAMVVGRGDIRTARQRHCHASRLSSVPNSRLNSSIKAA